MLSFRLLSSHQWTGLLLISLLTLAGCSNGGSSSVSLTAPTALSYPNSSPLIEGVTILSIEPTVSGGVATLFEVTPALPVGLTLDATTGEISGTPTSVTPLADYTVRASNFLGFAEFVLQLAVDPQAPCGLTYIETNVTYVVGQAISPNSANVGCGLVDLFSVTPQLPLGLSLDPVTGDIFGTPTAITAASDFIITASNVTGSDSVVLTIAVDPEAPCGIAFTDPEPVYTVGTMITPNSGSSACGPVTSWTISPALPDGLNLDTATGEISGTPTVVLAETLFTVTATNVAGSATVDLLLTVNPEAPCDLSYPDVNVLYLMGMPINENIPTIRCGTPSLWSVSPNLPIGIALDPMTGVIAGTPTAMSPLTDYTVVAMNESGSTSATISIAVNPQAPCGLSYAIPNSVYRQGVQISENVASFSCGDPDLWMISPELPDGLNFDTSTGTISGTPTVLSSLTTYTVTATNVTGSDSVFLTITVNPQAPCNLTFSDLAPTYTDQTEIVPNVPSFDCGPVSVFSVSPALPAGLELNPATGVISGTPTVLAPAQIYTVIASNVTGSDSVDLLITVVEQAPCGLTYSDPSAVYQLDMPITENTPSVSCGVPTAYSVSPALPAGLILNSVTGIITGTPTSLSAASTYVVSASNASGVTTFSLSIEVVLQPPCGLTYSEMAPIYLEGIAISPNVPSFQCGTPDNWIISPALPAGLAFDSTTGVISGVATELLPTSDFTITASNATGSESIVLTITVNPQAPCALVYVEMAPTYLVGMPISTNTPSFDCGMPSEYSVAPALPAGLILDSVTGVITGTPAQITGLANYTVTASNVTGSDSVTLAIKVDPQAPCNLSYSDQSPVYIMGTPIVSNIPSVDCGAPDTFEISPPLPAGLSMNSSNGVISGIPTEMHPATVHTVVASNVTGFDTTTVTITVNPLAPCNLTYSTLTATYAVNNLITPNIANVGCGMPEEFEISPALPSGLVLDAVTGMISGTPLVETDTTLYTVTASNRTGSDSVVLSITVNPEAPCDLTYSGPNEIYLIGDPIVPNLPSFNCGVPSSFEIAPSLPSGLILDQTTGAISGTPNTMSPFTVYTITASNVTGSDNTTISLTVNPQAPCNLTYSETTALYFTGMPITENTPSFDCGPVDHFEITPALPSGLTLNAVSGAISGTPTLESPSTLYLVTASNVSGSDSVQISIQVGRQAPCDLTYSELSAIYLLDTPVAPNMPSFNCGTPTSYEVTPALPAGLILDPISGVISGQPTELAPATTYLVTGLNATGSDSVSLLIGVNPQAPSSFSYGDSSPIYLLGDAITPNVPVITGGMPDGFSIDPALPAGLAINSLTGIISGTPTALFPATIFTVTATNVTGSDTAILTITVNPQAPTGLSFGDMTPVYLLDLPITANQPTIGGGAVEQFSVNPVLPTGLSLDPLTGVISGIPTVLQIATQHTITASNVTGSTDAVISITVNPQAPAALSYSESAPVYFLDSTITPNVPTIGGGAVDQFTVTPALPAGLAIDSLSGVITGTPTALQSVTAHTITATNITGSADTVVMITVNPLAPTSLVYLDPAAIYLLDMPITANTPSSAGGMVDSYAIAPALPAGLIFDIQTGVIDGTPTELFPATVFTVTATNITGEATATISITVNPQAPAGLSYATQEPIYLQGDPITSNVLTSTGGEIDQFTITPALPAGLLLDTNSGTISGTPTELSLATLYTVTGTNVTGSSDAFLRITVNPQAPAGLVYGEPSVTYILGETVNPNQPSTTGGPVANFVIAPALPTGLAIDSATGVISGTPAVLQAATVHVVTATNVTGSTSANVQITVNPAAPSGLTYDSLDSTYIVNSVITPNQPSASGGAIDSFSVLPALPAGLNLNSVTGVISGTPTSPFATAVYVVTATNVTGFSSVNLTITVNPEAPDNLNFSSPSSIYQMGIEIAPNVPTFTGGTPENWSISPALPAGLSIDSLTGIISGTPAAVSGTIIYVVNATNVTGSASTIITIAVENPAPCDLSYPVNAVVYQTNVAVTPLAPTVGCGGVDQFEITPALPAGLSFDTATGVLSGTPVEELLVTSFTVTATNTFGSDSFVLSIEVQLTAVSSVDYGVTTFEFIENVLVAPIVPTTTGGPVASFAVMPQLPAGLNFNTTTGAISGTPLLITALSNHTISATNAAGSASVVISVEVVTAMPCDLTYTELTVTYSPNVPITPNLASVGCGGAESFTVSPALPTGLILDAGTGTISGTPIVQTPHTAYLITASNALGSITVTLSIRIDLVYTFLSTDSIVFYDPVTGVGNFTQDFSVLEGNNGPTPIPLTGVSIAVTYDPNLMTPTTMVPGADLSAMRNGAGPSFFTAMDNGQTVTVGIIFDFMLMENLVADVEREMLLIDMDLIAPTFAGDMTGTTTLLTWENPLGSPPVDNLVVIDGSTSVTPVCVSPMITISPAP